MHVLPLAKLHGSYDSANMHSLSGTTHAKLHLDGALWRAQLHVHIKGAKLARTCKCIEFTSHSPGIRRCVQRMHGPVKGVVTSWHCLVHMMHVHVHHVCTEW